MAPWRRLHRINTVNNKYSNLSPVPLCVCVCVCYLMFLSSEVRAFTTALKASSLPGATHLSGCSSTASFLYALFTSSLRGNDHRDTTRQHQDHDRTQRRAGTLETEAIERKEPEPGGKCPPLSNQNELRLLLLYLEKVSLCCTSPALTAVIYLLTNTGSTRLKRKLRV